MKLRGALTAWRNEDWAAGAVFFILVAAAFAGASFIGDESYLRSLNVLAASLLGAIALIFLVPAAVIIFMFVWQFDPHDLRDTWILAPITIAVIGFTFLMPFLTHKAVHPAVDFAGHESPAAAASGLLGYADSGNWDAACRYVIPAQRKECLGETYSNPPETIPLYAGRSVTDGPNALVLVSDEPCSNSAAGTCLMIQRASFAIEYANAISVLSVGSILRAQDIDSTWYVRMPIVFPYCLINECLAT